MQLHSCQENLPVKVQLKQNIFAPVEAQSPSTSTGKAHWAVAALQIPPQSPAMQHAQIANLDLETIASRLAVRDCSSRLVTSSRHI